MKPNIEYNILIDHPTDSSEEIFKKKKNCNIQERWVNYKLSFHHQIHLLIKHKGKSNQNYKWKIKLNHLKFQSSHIITALDIFIC